MKTQAWHRTLGLWIGLFIFFYQLFGIVTGQLSVNWLLVTFVVIYIIALSITVGYHRLFTHFSFKCHRIWHYVFGIVGSMSLNSSPFHWNLVHSMHHRHADTALDSHDTTWRYFFRFRNKTGIPISKSSLRLMRDPLHRFLSNYSLGIFLLGGLITFLVDLNMFLYGFLSPIGVYLFLGGFHTRYAHHCGSPRDYWYLEFIFPSGGEWNHKYHHLNPGDPYFVSNCMLLDPGGYLIKVIRNDHSISKRVS